MRLRKIDLCNYCDDETGTHFNFPLLTENDNLEQIEAMIQIDMESYLSRNPTEGYFSGARRVVLPIVYLGDQPPRF